MATGTFHHVLGSINAHVGRDSSNPHKRFGTLTMRMSRQSHGIPTKLCGFWKLCYVRASTSHISAETVWGSPIDDNGDSSAKSNETVLTLMRHGESMWNKRNLFTGCVDVPLTEKGVKEAIKAGKRIRSIPIDVIYTSSLIRAQMTAVLAMTKHRCKKVPIILHTESEQARTWSKIHSEEAKKQSISILTAWQLNERMYGDLQGFNKQETATKFGQELVRAWRRTYHSPPPNGESLEMCAQRAVSYFREHIESELRSGKNVLVTAHANSLRAIIMHLEKLTAEEVIDLELLTGIPMLYIFKDGKFIRRGSPIGSSEIGVYAYTRDLALYRQQLDKMPVRHQLKSS